MKKFFSNVVSAIALLIGYGSVMMAQVTLPYIENFSGSGEQYLIDRDWENIDADADGKKWVVYSKYIHGTGFVSHVYSVSKDDTTPDNWLISPDVSGVKSVSYALGSTMPDKFQEHYSLLISKKTRDLSDFEEVFSETMEVPGFYGMFGYNLIKRAFNLPEGTKYVAWRHHNSTDLSSLVVDYIKFDNKELIVTLPYYEDFEQVSMDDLIEKGWYIGDENEDGVSWELNYTNDTWGNAITSASYINGSAITPRERLKLPAIPLSRSISYFIGSDHKENFRETYSLSAYVRSYNSFDTVIVFTETIEEPGTATDLSGANLKFRQFNLPIGTISVTIFHGGSPGGSHLILDNVTLSGEYVNGLPDIGYDTSTAVKMYARDGVVYLDGLQKGDLVQAYALSGKLMYSSVASDSSAQFSLPKGIYVLRLGNYSSKLIVD